MPAKSTTEQFVEKAKLIHDGRYGYGLVNYVDAKTKVTIQCIIHGKFEQTPLNHCLGKGCPSCYGNKKGDNKSFIEKAKLVHGEKYNYELIDYINKSSRVKIVCPDHGEFEQIPGNHLQGKGCTLCANLNKSFSKFKTTESFISESNLIHENRYDYSLCDYTDSHAKVKIVCPDHGEFEQSPTHHLNGQGCPKCYGNNSRPEFEICELIESLGLSYIHGDRKTISPQEIDILVPEANLAIEFNGNYWHSDKQKPKDYHFEKTRLANEACYRMIHVWEGDWETRKEQIKRILINACGKTNELMLNGRDCVVQEIEMRTINEFLDEHHIQGRVHTAAIKLGLIHKSEGLVAVMTFSKGANVRGTARINAEKSEVPWNLTRYAAKHSVRGGASKLFKHVIRNHGLNFIESYSMNDYFTGGMYQHLGFEKTVSYGADYRVYHPRIGMKFKYHWQRRNIPNVLRDIGRDDIVFNPDKTIDSRTEFEMEDLVGALRLWDSGKTKWTWRNIVDSE